jgi:tRNA nucleotidyltransferase (CCA-adding enzyme)
MNLAQAIEHRIFHVIQAEAQKLGVEVYVIGGFVRDLVIGRSNTDIDFVANMHGVELARNAAKALGIKKIDIFKTYGTAHFRFGEWDLEFVNARKESYTSDSRNPQVEQGTLQDDQNRRDFTINAMAISLQAENFGEVIDPFGGLDDLESTTSEVGR